MSSPNPLQPQGVLDSAGSPKSRVRITVLTILALHVVFIGGLLLQGCDKGGSPTTAGSSASNALSTIPSLTDTNYFSSFPGDGTASAPSSATPSVPPVEAFPSTPTSVDAGGTLPSMSSVPGVTSGYVPSTSVATTPSVRTTPSTPFAVVGSATEHVIKRGDILGSLAKHYGVTVQAILDANPGVKARNLKINDRLVIPAPLPAAPAPESRLAASEPLPPGAEAYLVKKGDNLTTIARKFGVTVRQLRDANNLRTDRLMPQQRLIIPPKAPANATTGVSTSATPRF